MTQEVPSNPYHSDSVIQPGEEKAPGRPYSSLPVPERGPIGKLERDFLEGHGVIGQGVITSS